MPEDKMYIPVQVGAEGKEKIEGYQPDNVGENISSKNPYFCELTGLYWAWKNMDSDYIGLVHYRRHFTESQKVPKDEESKFNILLKNDEIEKILFNQIGVLIFTIEELDNYFDLFNF